MPDMDLARSATTGEAAEDNWRERLIPLPALREMRDALDAVRSKLDGFRETHTEFDDNWSTLDLIERDLCHVSQIFDDWIDERKEQERTSEGGER